MSLNRWKVLACTLTVGVGGLAVFATDPTTTKADPVKESTPLPNLTVKPTSPSNGTDTPPPAIPVIPVKAEEFDLTLPVVPPVKPTTDDKAKKPTLNEPVFEPITPEVPVILLPVKGEDAKKPDVKTPDVKVPAAPPVIVLPTPSKPEVKDTPKLIAPPVVDAPKPAEATKPPALDLDIPMIELPKADPVPPKPSAPSITMPPPAPKVSVPPVTKPSSPPDTFKVPLATPTKTDSAKLKMLLRVGDGKPRFEIRNTATTELLLKVYCEKIEMQSPTDTKGTLAGVSAIGSVRFTAPGIEGTCEHLRIMSATGELLLEGQIRVKSKHGKTTTEMTADKMVFQIGTGGLATPGSPRTGVTPAGFIPD